MPTAGCLMLGILLRRSCDVGGDWRTEEDCTVDDGSTAAWGDFLAALGLSDRSAMVALLAGAPSAWVPTDADIAELGAVVAGAKSIDAFSAWLSDQWSADSGFEGGYPTSDMADATATAATAVLATRAKWLLDRAKEAKVIIERIRTIPAANTDPGG